STGEAEVDACFVAQRHLRPAGGEDGVLRCDRHAGDPQRVGFSRIAFPTPGPRSANGVVHPIVAAVVTFTAYWSHRLMHRVPMFWNIHKVHHSVTNPTLQRRSTCTSWNY